MDNKLQTGEEKTVFSFRIIRLPVVELLEEAVVETGVGEGEAEGWTVVD